MRSNHLSYRPICLPEPAQKGRRRQEPAQATQPRQVNTRLGWYPMMKGHEDGGYVLWNGRSSSNWRTSRRFLPISLERR
ncbi:hypothetical protein WDZ92_12760 [Nostoc sp. NIES-2111]